MQERRGSIAERNERVERKATIRERSRRLEGTARRLKKAAEGLERKLAMPCRNGRLGESAIQKMKGKQVG